VPVNTRDRSQAREETKMGVMTFVNLPVKDLGKATELLDLSAILEQ
jgi:hypothetical protein